jgi:hypothetical protein
MLDRWDNFFVMVGSGAAALAGLIFVAMSIKPEGIIRNTTHRGFHGMQFRADRKSTPSSARL